MAGRILRVTRRSKSKPKKVKRIALLKRINSSYLATAILLISLGVAAYILGRNWPLQKYPESNLPIIQSANPAYGSKGTEITLKGSNFDSSENTVIIIPSNEMAGYVAAKRESRSKITFIFPDSLDFCPPNAEEEHIPCSLAHPVPQPGNYEIKIQTQEGISNSVTFSLVDGE